MESAQLPKQDAHLAARRVSGRFERLLAETCTLENGGGDVRVATPQALYRLKKNTVRPINRADAAALRERFRLRDE